MIPLKGWKSSNVWEQIKILFRKELRADWKSGNACYHSVQMF